MHVFVYALIINIGKDQVQRLHMPQLSFSDHFDRDPSLDLARTDSTERLSSESRLRWRINPHSTLTKRQWEWTPSGDRAIGWGTGDICHWN